MARPIRNTPILYGEDAKRFLQEINTPISLEERKENRRRVEEGAERLLRLVEELNKLRNSKKYF